MYCEYYQATSLRKKTWFVMGCLKNEPNLTFYRTIDAKNNLFECFVTKDYEEHFLDIMNTLAEKGLVFNLVKKENRLLKETVAGEKII